MTYYFIVCRSLTNAQRTASILERAGITAHLLRTPSVLAVKGCSYSVKISQRWLGHALVLLKRAELSPMQVYITQGDGSYREVEL